MNISYLKTNMSRPLVVGLAALAAGVVIGAAAEKHGARTDANPGAAPAPSGALAVTNPGGPGAWDPFQEMREMQAQMDQIFRDSLSRLDLDPAFSQDAPKGYSLSLDVQDLKDHYQVRAFLPDADSSAASVNLSGNELKVGIDNQRSPKNGGAGPTELGHYEQVVTLSGNLKADQMKVEHKDHELVITIPKV